MAKKTAVRSTQWRSRIIGHGEEAPDQLLANPQNWRVHPKAQQDALGAVLDEVGWVQDVVVNRTTGHVVDGHLRVSLAISRQEATVPVVYVELTPDEERLVLATLDPLAAMATTDRDMLAELMAGIESQGAGIADLLAGVAEANRLPIPAGAGLTDPDYVPEPPAEPRAKRGDLWLLGDHRVLCGDSTDAADVARLMGGERAILMNTDPPYGVAYTDATRVAAERAHGRPARMPKWEDGIENDERLNEDIEPFLEACFRTASAEALLPDAAWYLWHAQLTQAFFAAAAAAAAALLIHRQIIWVKPSLLFGFGDYHWRHELCFYGWVQGNRPPFYGERNQTSVWELRNETSNGERVHPTQKPVELFLIPLRNHTREGDICYEPFAGSGSQIIAAEQLGRRCYGLEIEPKYVDVIVARWEAFTGRTAVLA